MDRRRHQGHDDDNDDGDSGMQPYALMQQWPDPMQPDHHQDISWNYAGSAAADWWLPHAAQDQFNQFAHFPPQPSGSWPVDHYSSAALDFQGAQFHPGATLPPADFEAIPASAQLIPDDELDGLLNPRPAGLPSGLGLDLGHGESQGRQRARQRISSPAKAILQKWFDDHIEDPYLEREDVSTLSEATGLTPRQVRTFFANARARKLPGPVPSQQSPPALPATDGGREKPPSCRPKQRQGSTELSMMKLDAPCAGPQSPMQRYLSSSPEDEGVSEERLRQAAASYAPQSSAQAGMEAYGSAQGRNPDTYSEAASSNSSNSSHASIDSAVNRVPRRGRKRHRGSLRRSNTVVRERTDPSKIFQCTFCNRDFAQKYDWRRHEESVHIPQKEWICMPDGAVRVDAASGFQLCVFCEQANPSHEHLHRHNYAPCLAAPQSSRTFTRKDKLIQHLGQVHKQSQMSPTMQTWCRRVSRNVVIACGICGIRLSTWNERVEHISTHFTDGLDMRYWLGAPGGVASLTAPAEQQKHHHHQHYDLSTTSPSSSSAFLSTAVDPLFPGHNNPPNQATAPSQPGLYYSCHFCPTHFPRYSETVFHERLAHHVFEVRPQPTDDGSNIRNPLQSRTKELALGGGDGGRAATTGAVAASGSRSMVAAAATDRGGGGPLTSPSMVQQPPHRAADPSMTAAQWASRGGTRGKELMEEGQERISTDRTGKGMGRPPSWGDHM